ncbi:hypothetical protein Pan216_44900 [Planctomycetes bacterium Pan216]|uniref:Uncharacterized protein n=1 Tax=Kolteria novifilia TaxID=2527975 RepID=A0A518B9G7_9BACT|nr:hypothetical protein Pan216_44900 [Planctomycetes bacterium Pan216]
MSEGFTSSETFDSEEKRPSRPKGQGLGCLGWSLIGCGGVLVVFVIAAIILVWYMKSLFVEDPVQAGKMLQEIVPCRVPEGYEPRMAMRIPIVDGSFVVIAPKGVAFAGSDEKAFDFTVFFVAHFPGATKEQLQVQLKQQGIGDGENVQVKDEAPVEIEAGGETFRGERAVSQGKGDGKPMVQYFFPLRAGVIMAAFGPEEKFDEAALKSFLGSIAEKDGNEAKAEPAKEAAPAP